MQSEAATYHLDGFKENAGKYNDDVRLLLEQGQMLLATSYVNALRSRAFIRDGIRQAFENVDVLVTPGLPGTTIPCGLAPNGLPVGIQIVGKPFEEAMSLRVADAFQRVTDWHKRRPPI